MYVNGKDRKILEPHGLPINTALGHGASFEVLKILCDSCVDALQLRDGYKGSVSLGISLRTNRCDAVDTINLLLLSNPKAAMVPDRRQNYPLHIACAKGAYFDVVNHLCLIYPEALFEKNFNRNTPLDIAQKNTMCPENVLDFLQELTFRRGRK